MAESQPWEFSAALVISTNWSSFCRALRRIDGLRRESDTVRQRRRAAADIEGRAAVEQNHIARADPGCPRSTPRTMTALSAALPPCSSSRRQRVNPNCSGSRMYSFTWPSRNSATLVGPQREISSKSFQTVHDHGARAAEIFQHMGDRPRRARRCKCRSIDSWPLPGLVSGPKRLKIVRMPISRRGCTAYFIASWSSGANRKPMPIFAMHCSTRSFGASTLTPRAPSTSALPDWLDTERLPCLATGTPAPASDERRRGRDIECSLLIPTGAAGIEYGF